jgi:hypothetical protein
MDYSLPLPATQAPLEHHADWLELRALQAGTPGVSIHEVIRDYKIGGVIDSLSEWEEGFDLQEDEDVISESIAEGVFGEVHERSKSSKDAYPFEIGDGHIQLRDGMSQSVYIFLALLSKYGKNAGPKGSNGERLFEDVCTKAVETYLGGTSPHVSAYAFGFPRRTLPKHFPRAIDELCKRMGEGVKSRGDQPKSVEQKDAKLDIVAWRDFADRRQGKLIAFGQCATGADWPEKRTELPGTLQWCLTWMERGPFVDPIRMFFVPHRVEFDEWERTCRHGGILFDRCRIASHVINLDPDVSDSVATWIEFVRGRMIN